MAEKNEELRLRKNEKKKKKKMKKKMYEEELWEITKEENKTTISCYLKLAKENKLRYRKQMHNLWNET